MTGKTFLAMLATVSVAALLSGAALAQTVFIAEGSANSVLVVDAASGATIRRIEGLESVHGLGGAPGVPVLVAGSFSEIDRADASKSDRPKGVSAEDHAAHHAPAKKSTGPANAGLSLLSILDAESGAILRHVEVPGAVHHVAVSPDGRFAVATHPAADGVSVIDLTRYELVSWTPTGPMPNYAVFGADPGVAFVSNAGNGTVSEVDLARGIVRRNLIVGESPEHMAINIKSGALYVADSGAGRVFELALDTGETRRSFDIGGEIHGLDLTDDRKRLIVAGLDEDKLSAIDLSNGAVTSVPLAPEPYAVRTVPGTGRVLVSSRVDPVVWIVDAAKLTVAGEIAVSGEGHQMVALD